MPRAYDAAVASLAARVGDDIALLAAAACAARTSAGTSPAARALDQLITVTAMVVGLTPDELWGAVHELEHARRAAGAQPVLRSLRMH